MLPPGSRLPSAVQTAMFMTDPIRMFDRLHRRHGPIFTVRYFGFPPEVYVTTAELAEQVFRTDQGGGLAGAARRDFLEHMVGDHSVLTMDGGSWAHHRKALTPPLRARQVAAYHDEITEIAAEKIAGWPLGEPMALRERMQEITLEVIIRLVFGIRDAERVRRLHALLPRLITLGGAASVAALPARLRERFTGVPFLPYTRFLKLRAAVDAILYEEIARRRRAETESTDVLGRLLTAGFSDQEIRDELITLLIAGHETTATSLAWAFERLLRLPHILERLPGDEAYLDAVIKEVMRIRPAVYEAPRLLDAPLELGGYEIPAGAYASVFIPLVHRDPDAFPEPDEFRPERFLDGPSRAWMPFGGGRRFCAGAQLALLEMRVIIREVLHRLDLTAPDPAPESRRLTNVTLTPARLTRVIARARSLDPTR